MSAQHRLARLHHYGVLERFRPTPVTEYHYVLGRIGAAITAVTRGEEPDARRWRSDHALAIATSQRLAHLLGINDIAVSLTEATRRREGTLALWMPEIACSRWLDHALAPDAYGEWHQADRPLGFFLEYDRGTETLDRLVAKLARYRWLENERGASTWVLYTLPSTTREANLRRELAACADADVPVATATLTEGAGPHEAIWLPLHESGERQRLAALADHPKPEGARIREHTGGRRPGAYRLHPHHAHNPLAWPPLPTRRCAERDP